MAGINLDAASLYSLHADLLLDGPARPYQRAAARGRWNRRRWDVRRWGRCRWRRGRHGRQSGLVGGGTGLGACQPSGTSSARRHATSSDGHAAHLDAARLARRLRPGCQAAVSAPPHTVPRGHRVRGAQVMNNDESIELMQPPSGGGACGDVMWRGLSDHRPSMPATNMPQPDISDQSSIINHQ